MTTTRVHFDQQVRKTAPAAIPANGVAFPPDERDELLDGAFRSLDESTLASGAQIRAAAWLIRHLMARPQLHPDPLPLSFSRRACAGRTY